MPPVLRALPYFDHRTTIAFGGRTVDVVPFQIALWVSVARPAESAPAPNARRFPAVLDTGFSGTFAITPAQLREWAGIEWSSLLIEPGPELLYQNVPVPHRRANLWVYPNQYGWRDVFDPIMPPYRLELNRGIAVFGNGECVGVTATRTLTGPRVPLLGLRALSDNPVALQLDPPNRHVWLDGA